MARVIYLEQRRSPAYEPVRQVTNQPMGFKIVMAELTLLAAYACAPSLPTHTPSLEQKERYHLQQTYDERQQLLLGAEWRYSMGVSEYSKGSSTAHEFFKASQDLLAKAHATCPESTSRASKECHAKINDLTKQMQKYSSQALPGPQSPAQ